MPNPIPSPPWRTLPPASQPLSENEIHLWRIPLQQPHAVLVACAAILSPEETTRAHRFHLPHLQHRFTVAHAALRHILAAYLNTAPHTLIFESSPQGKPSLHPAINPNQITFNLSHSNDMALLAVASTSRIGVDLEHRKPSRDLSQIATRNFSPAEAAAFFSLPESQRTNAFYACWTLKEAYLKATGDGLSTPLDSFEVRFPPLAPASLASVAGLPDEHLRWQAWSFTVDNHAAALIVEGRHDTIHRVQWSPPRVQA